EVERAGQYTVYVYNGNELAFYSKKVRKVDGILTPSMQLTNIWDDTPYEGIASEGGVTLKGGKKPEKLLKRIIELSTNPGDLALDYFIASGTTASVAHKLNSRYIGLEQLNYGENDSTERLINVIDGDNNGVYNAIQRQDCDSFVYCQLDENGVSLFEEIEKATDEKILEIKEKIYNDYSNVH